MSFIFKLFAIDDSHCAMKFGTDAMLLGSWTAVRGDERHLLDLGCGCGVLALMLAQRTSLARIIGVEIDPTAALDAEANFTASRWSDRLSAICADAAQWSPDVPLDLIVCNPPYHTETLRSPNCTRASARHAGSLSPDVALRLAAQWLAPCGSLAMVSPASAHATILSQAKSVGLYPWRICEVSQHPDEMPSRILWQFSRLQTPTEYSVLTLREASGAFTSQYLTLTADYHAWPPN